MLGAREQSSQPKNRIIVMFEQIPIISFETMRVMVGLAAICTLVLFIYRITTVIHCMSRDPESFPSHVDRVVWAILAMIVPLGIGAYLYDVVSRKNPFRLIFLIPFAGVLFSMAFVMIEIWPHATRFQFDFLGV